LLFLFFTKLGAALKGSSFGAWLGLSLGTELGIELVNRLGCPDLRKSLGCKLEPPVSEIGSELGTTLGDRLGERIGF
jgi:hypothetical protein